MSEPFNELDRESELQLIRAARSGDETAFTRLVHAIYPRLRNRVRHAVRARSDVDADDIVQDVLARAWTNLDQYQEHYRWGQFVLGIAHYQVLHRLGRKPREISTDWAEDPKELAEGTSILPSPDAIPDALRPIAGAHRHRAPDAATLAPAIFLEMLEALLGWGGWPHQQLAFSYSIIVWGKGKREKSAARIQEKVPITGDPDRVVDELSGENLGSAAQAFRDHLEANESVAPARLRRAFEPFQYRLLLDGSRLFARDKTSTTLYSHVLHQVVGDTRLRDYYGKDPRKSVADWTEGVKSRVFKYLKGNFDLARSPLPWPAGHEN